MSGLVSMIPGDGKTLLEVLWPWLAGVCEGLTRARGAARFGPRFWGETSVLGPDGRMWAR